MSMEYIYMIAGMTLVTYLPRVLPLAILTRLEIPEIIIRWLRYIPAAILAALLAPAILMIDGQLTIGFGNVKLLAAIPTFLVAIYKKNIFYTVVTGVVVITILDYFL